MTLRIRKGSQGDYDARVLAGQAEFEPGEPVWVADNKLYIGNGVNGGVLVNPSITAEPAAPGITVETVVVERSRSTYIPDLDGNTIDLGAGNNFRVSGITDAANRLTFINPSNGQSGYLVVTVANAVGAVIGSSATVTVFVPGATASTGIVLAQGTHFISYTVGDTNEIYITSAIVTASTVS